MSEITYIVGDVFDQLATLDDGSVDLMVTSPPFLALRSYLPAGHPDKSREIGSEATPAEFLDVLLAVTAELRRVLAPHGSIAIELGDTYASDQGRGPDWTMGGERFTNEGPRRSFTSLEDRRMATVSKFGPGWPLAKSKTLIPELYRIALAYGINPLTGQPSPAGRWRVRNVVTWCRPNPPVGALGDKWRPATSDVVVACVSPKRYWDDLATRKPHSPNTHRRNAAGVAARANETPSGQRDGNWDTLAITDDQNPSGAPLLDYWEIPPGGYSGKVATNVRRRVDPHESAGDIEHIVSADCPQHGGRPGLPPTGSHDGQQSEDRSHHNPDTDSRPVQEPLAGFASNDENRGRSGLSPSPKSGGSLQSREAIATSHSKASHKTGPAPETNPSDTPSEETSLHIGDTQVPLSSDEHHPDTSESNTSASDSTDSPTSRTADRTPDTETDEASSEACSCSFYVTETQYTSHYAVFPPELVVPLVKAMCPQRVCVECGEPSRRITETTNAVGKAVGRKAWMNGTEGIGEGHSGEITVEANDRTVPDNAEKVTLGWSDCGHDNWRPGHVLDPFAGSGTTLAVAHGHGHDATGIDLDERNAELARERVGPMFFTRRPATR